MTDQEFGIAVSHHTSVIHEIQKFLRENKMSLNADNGEVWLCDDGRDIRIALKLLLDIRDSSLNSEA